MHTGDQTHSLGRFPDEELNPQPFSYGTMLQPTEPHWPGHNIYFLLSHSKLIFFIDKIILHGFSLHSHVQ